MPSLLSVDEILLPRYANSSTNFRGLPLKVETTHSRLKHMYCDLFGFTIGQAGRMFVSGPGDLGSIPGRVITKTLKILLDTSLLNTQQYKVCIKGRVEQSWERISALPYTSMW